MHHNKWIVAIMAIVCSSIFVSTASASNKAFDMSVVPQVSFVSSGSNVTVTYSVTNNTSSDASCYFHVTGTDPTFDAPLGVVYAGQSAGGSLTTPALHKNSKINFELICGGNSVGSRTVNVKVR